jgi:preprotein translocase subunit SecA
MDKVAREQVRRFLTAPDGDLLPPGAVEEGGVEPVVDRMAALQAWLTGAYGISLNGASLDSELRPREQIELLTESVLSAYDRRYQEKRDRIGEEGMRRIERFILLLKIDEKWKDHLYAMDHLRHAISLRGYGQIDPKVAYKQEGYQMFAELIENLRSEITELLLRVEVRKEDESRLGTNLERAEYRKDDPAAAQAQTAAQQAQAQAGASSEPVKPIRNIAPKIGRNDPCPCGSGKKYKRCCGFGKAAS